MPILNKTKRTAAIYNRGREVVKVYDHGTLAWQKQSSIPDYLCFTALEAGTFTLTIPAAVTPTYLSYVEWSKDGRTWNRTDNTSEAVTIDVQVASGEKVYWRGSGKRMTYSGNSGYTSGFSSTGDFSISGHLVSIIKGSDFENIDFLSATFARLFQDCSNLVSAEELILPSFTVGSVFSSMFLRCTALVSAPELPPVTNLTTGCFYQMFFGCSSLTYVKCLATDISATNCLYNWLSGVSSTGTFIQASGVTWPRGASGIPTGWLAYDEGEEIPNDYTPCDYIFNPSSASAAAVAIGTTSGINEPFEVDFQATEIVTSDRPVAGYGSSNSSVSPVQGSMSYFYLRVNPDSFQHQVFRLNTSGDTIASTNGLLKNGRDLDRHTAKVTYTYNESTEHYLRNLYFDGVLTHSSTTVHPTPLIGIEFYVFGFSSSGSRFINGKIYGLRWWGEDEVTLKANLIPCSRNSDGAAGFWDTAQKQFFTSTYWTAHFDNE